MLATPVPSGEPHPGLDFVEDQQNVIFIANPSQRLQPFTAEMIVAALALIVP